MSRSVALCFTLCLIASPALSAKADTTPVGRKVDEFSLQDYRGTTHSLSDYRDSRLVVLAVLGTECPLAKLYGPRLARLEREYAPRGVAFLGINANVQDSITEIAAYARIHQIEFPILKDVGNKVVDRLGAVRTPEIFVLDEDRTVRYWGRVDDQYGVGYQRDKPERNDLAVALDELLAGQPVETPVTVAVGCHIGRVRQPKENAPVTYSNQIARIFQNRCVECHREGEIAPFALTDYDEVKGWAEMIREVVEQQRMPPWNADPHYGRFANDRSLSEDEKQQIYRWVADGAPEGDSRQLPAPREYVTGWSLPRAPDLVLNVTDEPFHVPAEGEVKYQWFTVDPGFTEDKWLKVAEILPGNRAVVHHILAFTREPGETGRVTEGEGFLVGYVPGLRPRAFPEGMAKFIPAGSKLVFQVHYTPVGTEQLDQSRIGLVFADPSEVTHRVQTTQAINFAFEIPKRAADHMVEATSPAMPEDVLLLTMMPHMHLRGKSFLYEARYPDGRTETLLDVPHYDFNWQTGYRLSEPKLLPAGTRIHCVAHYDNSENNLNNPAPDESVRWGDQTWEEMMIGYFDIAWPVDPAEAKGRSGLLIGNADPHTRAEAMINMFDKNGDGKMAREEVPLRMLVTFLLIDADHDGIVTLDEMTASIEKRQERGFRRRR